MNNNFIGYIYKTKNVYGMRKVLLYHGTECLESGASDTLQGTKRLLHAWKSKYNISRLNGLIIIQQYINVLQGRNYFKEGEGT